MVLSALKCIEKNEFLAKIWRREFLVRIATWNTNSVRLRLYNVLRFIKEENINVICLQKNTFSTKNLTSKTN